MPTPNMGRGGMQCPPGMPQSRMPGNTSSNMKADGTPLWAHPGRHETKLFNYFSESIYYVAT